MAKFIVLLFVAIGWYAASMAFFSGAWAPMSWHIPFTGFHPSWGLIGMVGLLYMGHKATN